MGSLAIPYTPYLYLVLNFILYYIILYYIMREIKIPLRDILDFICSADDYGFITLLPTFAEYLDHQLSDEEIEAHALSILELDEYDEDDYNITKQKLHDFKEQYID